MMTLQPTVKLKQLIPCLILFFLFGCDTPQKDNVLDQALVNGKPLFVMAYSKLFAQRFSMAEQNATDLPKNLHAISIEINKINHRYSCALNLYIDDKLDIYSPAAGPYFYEKPLAEYYFVKAYNDADQAQNSRQLDTNLMHILFRSSSLDNSDKGLSSTLGYRRVHRSYLPGISLYTLNTECLLFERQNYPADIWMQKQQVDDYLLGNDDPGNPAFRQNSYRFPIPLSLINDIQPYISIAVEENFRAP